MSNTRAVIIYWGGIIIQTESGPNVAHASSRMVNFIDDFDLQGLHNMIRNAVGVRDDTIIKKILFRHPIKGYSQNAVFGFTQIGDDFEVRKMFEMVRQFTGWSTIELYIEFTNDTGTPVPCVEASSSTYNRNEVEVEEEEDECFDEDEEEEELQVNDEDVEEDEDDDEEHFFDEDDDENDPHDYCNVDGAVEVHNDFSIVDGAFQVHNDDSMVALLQRINREIPSQFERVNLEEMYVNRNSSDVDDMFWDPSKELVKGMLFQSRDAVKTACKLYSLKVGRQFRSSETRYNTITLVCQLGCEWRLRATEMKRSGFWQITRYNGPHTCSAPGQSQDNRNFDSNLIAGYIQAMLQEQPGIKVKALLAGLKERFGITPSYKKVWKGKQKAIANLWGDWDESYKLLCQFMHAAVTHNPGSFWHHEGEAHLKNHVLVDGVRQFKRMVFAFKPCIDGFKHCKPVIYVDGTFLYGKYRSVLLTAEAVDGNNAILPLAFGLVEKESKDNWEYFMNMVRYCCCDGRDDICVISDRHIGIKHAMKQELWCANAHRYCLRHVLSNYNTKFKNGPIKNLLDKAGREFQKRKFQRWIDKVELRSPESKKWIDKIPKEKWTLSYDGGHRHGVMTTNYAESVNAMFKSIRSMPVTTMMHQIFLKLVDMFDQHRTEYTKLLNDGFLWTPTCVEILKHRIDKANGHVVQRYDQDSMIFQITTAFNHARRKSGHKQVVDMK